MFRRRIRRNREGTFDIRLPEEERELVATLTGQLRAVLVGTADDRHVDPSLRRLFPTAYADDADLDAEYHSLVHDDLRERRLAAIDTVAATIEQERVDEEQLLTWMGAVNDVRLVLGTRLDVSEDMDELPPADHPDHTALAVYGYLAHLLEEIVSALAD